MSATLCEVRDIGNDKLWARLWAADVTQPPYYQPAELLAAARHLQPVYYLPDDLRYEQNRDTLLGFEPEHVVAVDDDGPVLGLALTVERHVDGTRLSCFGKPLYLVVDGSAAESRVAAAAGPLWTRLTELAGEHGVAGYHVRDFLVGGRLSPLSERVLRAGGRANPYFVQVVDLRPELSEIWSGLRDNHRRILRKRTGQVRLTVVGADTVRPEHGDLMSRLHRIMRGSTVRSADYWRAVVEGVRADEGFLVVAEEDGAEVAGAHFAMSDRAAFYSTAAHDPERKGVGLSHVVLWRAIEHARERGCAGFEVGDRVYPGQHRFVDDKLQNISHFKAGFGGGAALRVDVLAGTGSEGEA
ncbi:GNAT family N-acetyltransferase [Actinokineospora enzanensis]|uniref:GNAT family N-acetyltransferase n=1 Tax=Actinokineospora enzanensis TaxID=155975 RepID=UPI00037FBCD1|nr:GNAT family N-acetyltransferase [Actinokineospora enzanensis]